VLGKKLRDRCGEGQGVRGCGGWEVAEPFFSFLFFLFLFVCGRPAQGGHMVRKNAVDEC